MTDCAPAGMGSEKQPQRRKRGRPSITKRSVPVPRSAASDDDGGHFSLSNPLHQSEDGIVKEAKNASDYLSVTTPHDVEENERHEDERYESLMRDVEGLLTSEPGSFPEDVVRGMSITRDNASAAPTPDPRQDIPQSQNAMDSLQFEKFRAEQTKLLAMAVTDAEELKIMDEAKDESFEKLLFAHESHNGMGMIAPGHGGSADENGNEFIGQNDDDVLLREKLLAILDEKGEESSETAECMTLTQADLLLHANTLSMTPPAAKALFERLLKCEPEQKEGRIGQEAIDRYFTKVTQGALFDVVEPPRLVGQNRASPVRGVKAETAHYFRLTAEGFDPPSRSQSRSRGSDDTDIDENYNPTALQHSLKKGGIYASMGKHRSRIKWAGLWEDYYKNKFGRLYFEAREREVAENEELQLIWQKRLEYRHSNITNTEGAPWLNGSMTTKKVAKAVLWDANPLVRSVTATIQAVKLISKYSGASKAAEKAAAAAKEKANSKMTEKQKKRLSDATEMAEAQRLKLRGVKYEDIILGGPKVPPLRFKGTTTQQSHEDEFQSNLEQEQYEEKEGDLDSSPHFSGWACRLEIEEAFETSRVRVAKFQQRAQESQARIAGLKVKLIMLLIQIKIRNEKMKMGLTIYSAMRKRNLDEAAEKFMEAREIISNFIEEIRVKQAEYRRICEDAGIPYEEKSLADRLKEAKENARHSKLAAVAMKVRDKAPALTEDSSTAVDEAHLAAVIATDEVEVDQAEKAQDSAKDGTGSRAATAALPTKGKAPPKRPSKRQSKPGSFSTAAANGEGGERRKAK